MNKWKAMNKDIQIVILGDLQETVSITNRDNLGEYRQPNSPLGILQLVESSHVSIARKLGGAKEYITRFGHEGGRGIDHILVPQDGNMPTWILDARVQRDRGAMYFPSDHSLITCKFNRFGMNNNQSSHAKQRYDFRRIYSIKLKQKGQHGEILELDDTQFKDCSQFRDQKILYEKLQHLTGNNANLTNAHIDDIEVRIQALYKSLWKSTLDQKCEGAKNMLVDISENQALNLSYTLRSFNQGVRHIMEKLKLVSISDSNDKAGKTRGAVRKRKGFKLFDNLPIQTKIRYLKQHIVGKNRLLKQKLLWLAELKLRRKHNRECQNFETFWDGFNKLSEHESMEKKAALIDSELKIEIDERTRHIEALKFEKEEAKQNLRKSVTKKEYKKILRQTPNTFQNVNKKLVSKINFWLSESNCNQAFNSSNVGDAYATLSSGKLGAWKDGLEQLKNENYYLNILDEAQTENIEVILATAKNDLKNLFHSLTRVQSAYRKETLMYFLDSNNIEAFTRKVLPKARSAPAAHSTIWDSSINDFRNCIDETEQMKATSQFHGKWMGNSQAEEVCAYAEIVSKGKLGSRGIKLKPDRKITKKDLKTLLPNFEKSPAHIKSSFLAAHGEHTANLFKEPDIEHPDLFYPFYLVSEDGKMQEDSNFLPNFWRSLARIPSKARFEGFQMSVLGRFGERWRKALLDIIKLILITRFIPPELRQMARFPIPKPGKQDEYRPISLCNDIYCYINAIITSYTSLGIERAGILHDGMCAYRKGRGCASLVTMELSFREDCAEHNLPVLQLDEDEEKFFDRVPVEILLAAMRTNGFPNQGFLEIKASSMQAKTVEIITSTGIAYAKFVCGLEQGNPDSPTISNLVIKFKHDIWQTLSEEAKKILIRDDKIKQGYTFQTPREGEKLVHLCRIGYCDDNSKFCCVSNEEDLLFLATYYLQLSGDLSMVTKIGRKSSKCELQFFNISADLAIRMKQFWSTAWSYVEDGPVEERVPFKINMKKDELAKLYKLINYDELDEIEKAKWDGILHAKAHKHLGLKCSLNADTSMSSQETIAKIQNRFNQLKIQNMHEPAQVKCLNMLCVTMHSCVPLQVQYNGEDLTKVDKAVGDLVRKRHGITSSDSNHRLFLPKNRGGKGIISFLDQDLIAVTRELEIISNLYTLDGDTFRTRIQANCRYSEKDDDIINHARVAIQKLARYGIFFRDRNDDIINNVLSSLNQTAKFPSIGCSSYSNGNRSTFYPGLKKNLDIAFGGKIWKILQSWDRQGRSWNEEVKSLALIHNVDWTMLKKHTDGIQEKRFSNVASMYSFWEWRNSDFTHKDVSNQQKHWKFIDMPKLIQKQFPSSFLSLNDTDIKRAAQEYMELQGWNPNPSKPRNSYDFFHRLFDYILKSDSPIFISSDGGHEILDTTGIHKNGKSTITTAAFVISVADIREGETLQSGQWINRAVIPLLSRASILPQKIGTTSSDIATGELWAFALSEFSLPGFIPRIVITDSKSTRELVLKLRDKEDKEMIDRAYIRSLVGGVSKFIFSTFQNKLWNTKVTEDTSDILTHLKKRMRSTCLIGNTWIGEGKTIEDDTSNKLYWEPSYFDHHDTRSIWKVNSHQLNDAGSGIKNNRRYDQLIPNLSILSTNHHADKSADFVKKFNLSTYNIDIVNSTLRYFITWNGKTIDRHTSTILSEQFAEERIKRLKTKATQGLLWRFYDDVEVTWDILELHKGWLRCLLGLSRSHTRCLYKDECYRDCCKAKIIHESNNAELIKSLDKVKNKQETIKLLSKCMWCEDYPSKNGKGNRKHAFLSCQRPDLKNFRNEMRDLINDKLIAFFSKLHQATSFAFAKDVILDIEKEFLQAQALHMGRTKKVPNHRNNLYLPINQLLLKWDINTWQSFHFRKSCYILSEIFGLEPNSQNHIYDDEELGIIDAPWLGLVPKFMEKIITSACTYLDGKCDHHETKKLYTTLLLNSWEEIKELMMGKAIGMHRIIGTTGTEFEQTISKTFGKNQATEANNKHPSSLPSSISSPILPRKKRKANAHESNCLSTPPTKLARISKQSTTICTGVTCGREAIFWCADNAFTPNKINCGTKQCTRCGRYMTAFKRIEETLDNMLLDPSNEKILTKIILFCTTHPESLQYKYASFMNMLDVFLPPTMRINKALYTNKKTIPERHKLLCRLLHKSILHSSRQSDVNSQIINRAKNLIQKLQQNKKISFLQPNTSNIIPPITANTPDSPNDSDSPIKLQLPEAIEANGTSWLSGMAMTKAIDVIRSWNRQNIFLGNGDSNTSIQNWESTHQWDSFARIFGSEQVMNRKPDGIYCIPIFSGAENAGHWHLVVIHKSRRNYLGWILDSLNTVTGDDIIHRKIATAFCPGRNTFRWGIHPCLPQIELECGIRVLSGILDIANGLQNDDSIANCILSASRTNNPNESYNPRILRQRIALLINTHQPSMITTLSRRRRRQLQSLTLNQQRNKKRKQLKKSRKSATEPIQID